MLRYLVIQLTGRAPESMRANGKSCEHSGRWGKAVALRKRVQGGSHAVQVSGEGVLMRFHALESALRCVIPLPGGYFTISM